MKKILAVVVLCIMAIGTGYAQKGEMTAGLQFQVGAGSGLANPGLGAKFSYSITDPWRLAASVDYDFKVKRTSVWDINVDCHYQFFFGKGFRVYPLLGITVVGYHTTPPKDLQRAFEAAGQKAHSVNTTCVGMNIGGGFQYDINDAWGVYTEVKGQCVSNHGSRFVWSVGGCSKF